MAHRLFAPLMVLILSAATVSAQGYGANYGAATGLNNRTTNQVVRLLQQGLRRCQALDSVYRYDCYRQNYRDAGQKLEGNDAYAPAREALRDVETALSGVLNSNADPTAQPVRRRGKTFTAISAAAVPRSKAVFTKALDTAATQLLRSSGSSGDHFARIADVLDSEKVFLRS